MTLLGSLLPPKPLSCGGTSTMVIATAAFVAVGAVAWAGLEATRPDAELITRAPSDGSAVQVLPELTPPAAPKTAQVQLALLDAPKRPRVIATLHPTPIALLASAATDPAPAKVELVSAQPAPETAITEDVPRVKIVEVRGPSCVERLQRAAADKIIHFRIGSATVDPGVLPGLRALGQMAQDCPNAVIHVAGHSDASGSDFINLSLSWKRADNAVAALAGLGLDTSKFEPVGFGARSPFEQGDAGDSALDRRVEFQVLSKAGSEQ